MYAIVKTGGKQYTVKPGDVLDVEKLEGEAGDTVKLEALFLNDGSNIVTDADALAATDVVAQIVEQHKGDKQIVFKFKKRKGYKRTRGHRQQLTRIAITNVAGEKAQAPAPKPAKVEEPKDEAGAEEPKPEKAEKQLSSLTVAELKDIAKERGIKIPSGARKADIIELIENA